MRPDLWDIHSVISREMTFKIETNEESGVLIHPRSKRRTQRQVSIVFPILNVQTRIQTHIPSKLAHTFAIAEKRN